MKRIIIITFLAVIMAANLINANLLPYPIAIKVSANQNCEFSITNTRTGDTVKGITVNGEAIVDWSQKSLSAGDEFEIKIGNEIKKFLVTDTTIPPGIITFDIVCEEQECPEPEPCLPCPEPIDCYDQGYILPDDCPKTDETLNYLILFLIGFVFGIPITQGVGIVIRKNKSGEIKAQVTRHKHYGIRSYHSIYTIHKDPNIRHPKGEINPVYKSGRYIPINERGD